MLAIRSVGIPLHYRRRTKTVWCVSSKFIASKLRRINVNPEPYQVSYAACINQAQISERVVTTNMIELGVEATVVDFIQSRVPSSVLAVHYIRGEEKGKKVLSRSRE